MGQGHCQTSGAPGVPWSWSRSHHWHQRSGERIVLGGRSSGWGAQPSSVCALPHRIGACGQHCAGAVWLHTGDGVRRTPPRCRRRTGSAPCAWEVPPDLAQNGKPPSSHPKSPVPQGRGAEQQLRGCWMIQVRGRQSLPPRRRNPPAPRSLVTQPRAASCSAPRHPPRVPPASSPRRAGVSQGCSEAAAGEMLSP